MSENTGAPSASAQPDVLRPSVRETLSEALVDPEERARLGIAAGDDDPMPVMIELNIAHPGGLEPARARLMALCSRVCPDDDVPVPVSGALYKGWLTIDQSRRLVLGDAEEPDRRLRAIYRIWPDFPLRPLVVR